MTFAARDDAVAWLSARRAEIEMEVWAPEASARGAGEPVGADLEAYADIWLETRKTKGRALRPTTRQQYRMLLDKFIYPTFGESASTGSRLTTSTPGTTPSAPGRETIRAHAYSLLRTIFTSAASERPHAVDPLQPGSHPRRRQHEARPPCPAGQLEELGSIVEELPDRYKLMALLAAWCAMRFGELAELRRGDIDLRTSRVKIRRGVVRVDGEFIVGPPKTDAGVRDVAIPPHLMPLVKDHLADHTAPGRDALLFPAAADRTCTWRRRRSTRSTTRLARPPAARISVGTTSATPALSSPRRPARRLPS